MSKEAQRLEGWPLFLILPFPLSVNTYWRKGRGRIYLSPRGRQYKKDVAALVLINHFAKGGERQIAIPLGEQPCPWTES